MARGGAVAGLWCPIGQCRNTPGCRAAGERLGWIGRAADRDPAPSGTVGVLFGASSRAGREFSASSSSSPANAACRWAWASRLCRGIGRLVTKGSLRGDESRHGASTFSAGVLMSSGPRYYSVNRRQTGKVKTSEFVPSLSSFSAFLGLSLDRGGPLAESVPTHQHGQTTTYSPAAGEPQFSS